MSGLRSARLVGRDAEMEQLRRAVEDVRGGDPALLLVEGEAGIGKTRLVTEAIAQLGAPTDLAATGGGFALGGEDIPFVAASGVVRALVRGLGPAAVLEAGGPALGVLAPELAAGDHEHDRGEVLSAVVGLVEQLARDRMLWLVFEDLHWVDSSSRELIGYLVSTLGPCQALMVCTRRTHDQPPGPQLLEFVAELVRHPRGHRMTLHRLTGAEVAEQIADLTGEAPEPGFVESVAARSQGNPFLTEELVDATRDGHGGVTELMLSRVQGLDEDARRVVEAAAVGDGHAEHALLARVCGLPDRSFSSALSSAIAASVLEDDPSGDRYVFRHALLREAVDKTMLPDERKEWHRRWGEELEADAARLEDGPAQIAAAQHWFETDDALRAFDAGVKAENAAWSMRASVEQARLCLRLVDLLSLAPERAHAWQNVRIDYAWTAIGALTRTGDWAEQLALAERELQQPEATTEPAWRIYLELVRRDCADLLGRPATEPLDVDADVAELLEAAPNNLVTQALLWYREVLWDLGLTSQAARLLDRASEVSDAMVAEEVAGLPPGNNPPDGVSTAMKNKMMIEVNLADQEWFQGRTVEALARVGSLMPLARRPGAFDGQDHLVFRVYAAMLTSLGRCREAADVSREAIRLLGPVESNRVLWLEAVASLAESLFAVGEWDEVDDLLLSAVGGDPHIPATVDLAVISAALCCARGELDAAEGWLGSVSTRAGEGHRDREIGPHHWLLAELTAARGDVSRAREHLEPCWAWPEREVEWRPMADLLLLAARLEADAPDGGTPDRVARIRERADRRVKRGDLGLAWSAHLEAELLRAAGSNDPDPWSEAAVAWGHIGHPHQQGWALFRQAECLVAGGDRGAAVAPLTRALQIGRRLRAQPLVDAAAGLARRARVAVDGLAVPRQRSSSLTERELDVLRLLADGCSNARIAETLFISPKTASVHVSHILTKLDVSTRTEAAAVAIRQQLLDEEGP